MKSVIVLFFFTIILFLSSCDNKPKVTGDIFFQCPMKCEGEKIYVKNTSCPVCKMDLRPTSTVSKKVINDEISDESIFNLTSKWNIEEGKTITLKQLKGKTLVVVMIYTTCKADCPRLTADMRNINDEIPHKYKKDVNYILVSLDPETDTPKRLKEFALENYMDQEQYTFLQGTKSSVREFANVLAVKY
jgi:protein SCO1/2